MKEFFENHWADVIGIFMVSAGIGLILEGAHLGNETVEDFAKQLFASGISLITGANVQKAIERA